MNMNLSAMMSLTGNQSIKMSTLAKAMTTGEAQAEQADGFLSLVQNLMDQSSDEQLTANQLNSTEESEIMSEELLAMLKMVEQPDTEVSEALLAFLKQSKEIDLTKVDASWLQAMVAVVLPYAESGQIPAENVGKVVSTIAKYLPERGQTVSGEQSQALNVEQRQKIESALLEFGMSKSDASAVLKQVVSYQQEFQINDQSNQNAVPGPVKSQSVWQKSSLNQPKQNNFEVVTSQKQETDPMMLMHSMKGVRPVVVEANKEELQLLTEDVESIDLDEAIPFAQNVATLALKTANNDAVVNTETLELKQSVVNQVEQAVIHAIKEPNEEFVMKLRPEGLGEITIKMVMNEGGKVVLNIQTQSQEVKAIVSQELHQLRSALVPLNAEVGEVSTYVSNEGFFQQSAYEQNRQNHQPEFHRSTKQGYEFFNQEEVNGEVVLNLPKTQGRLYKYV